MILDKSPRQHTGVKPKPDPSIYSTDTALQNALNNVDWVPTLEAYINTQGWNDAIFLEREFTVKQMYEAASANSCDPVVFPMAVSIFDRYCSKIRINLQEYLTVGMTCLLMSSKINMTKPLRERTLIRSVRPDPLLQEKALIVSSHKTYPLNFAVISEHGVQALQYFGLGVLCPDTSRVLRTPCCSSSRV